MWQRPCMKTITSESTAGLHWPFNTFSPWHQHSFESQRSHNCENSLIFLQFFASVVRGTADFKLKAFQAENSVYFGSFRKITQKRSFSDAELIKESIWLKIWTLFKNSSQITVKIQSSDDGTVVVQEEEASEAVHRYSLSMSTRNLIIEQVLVARSNKLWFFPKP